MGGEKRRAKSLRNGVHHADGVVWGPVYRTRLIRGAAARRRRRGRLRILVPVVRRRLRLRRRRRRRRRGVHLRGLAARATAALRLARALPTPRRLRLDRSRETLAVLRLRGGDVVDVPDEVRVLARHEREPLSLVHGHAAGVVVAVVAVRRGRLFLLVAGIAFAAAAAAAAAAAPIDERRHAPQPLLRAQIPARPLVMDPTLPHERVPARADVRALVHVSRARGVAQRLRDERGVLVH
eukprot:31386-Pelagococcus_subviridis.AAC.9